jgi:hypothetical protein
MTWAIVEGCTMEGGQQVMMAPFGAPEYGINEDQWDGYPAERFFKTV